MNDDIQIILTPEQAEALLPEGDTMHSMSGGGFVIVGCNHSRENTIKAFRSALQIEIGGPACKSMKHPIVVWDRNDHCVFYQADMEKVEAFEAAFIPVPA